MKLLFLTSRLPYPPNRGDRLRTYHFLKNLSKEHQITLVSFTESNKEAQQIKYLKPFCTAIHTVKLTLLESILSILLNFWRKLPLQVLYYRSVKMERTLDKLLKENEYDAVYIHLFRMAQFMWNKDNLYRIVDLTDIISNEIGLAQQYRKGIQKAVYALEYQRILSYEKRLVANFEEIWLISAAESNQLARIGHAEKIKVVTNGVDLDVFYPLECQQEEHTLLFLGHMGVFHNTNTAEYLAREVFPLVLKTIPDCKLIIAGAEADKTINFLGELPNVEVKGFVPDLNLLLNKVSLFVAPLRFSAGVQNKVLEAMATGTPVVTTSLVNTGLNAQPERDLLLGNTPDQLAIQVVKLLNDEKLREKIGKGGKEFVCRNFSWNAVNNRIREIKL